MSGCNGLGTDSGPVLVNLVSEDDCGITPPTTVRVHPSDATVLEKWAKLEIRYIYAAGDRIGIIR